MQQTRRGSLWVWRRQRHRVAVHSSRRSEHYARQPMLGWSGWEHEDVVDSAMHTAERDRGKQAVSLCMLAMMPQLMRTLGLHRKCLTWESSMSRQKGLFRLDAHPPRALSRGRCRGAAPPGPPPASAGAPPRPASAAPASAAASPPEAGGCRPPRSPAAGTASCRPPTPATVGRSAQVSDTADNYAPFPEQDVRQRPTRWRRCFTLTTASMAQMQSRAVSAKFEQTECRLDLIRVEILHCWSDTSVHRTPYVGSSATCTRELESSACDTHGRQSSFGPRPLTLDPRLKAFLSSLNP